MLEAIDVAIGRGLVALSVLIGEIRVELVRGRLRLTDDDGRERDDGNHDRRRKRQVHERDREAAADADLPEPAHERVEQKRDQRADDEENDDVSRRLRDDPHQDEQERQADQLDPTRDLDPGGALEPRRRAGGGAHVAPIVQPAPTRHLPRPPARVEEEAPFVDGSLARLKPCRWSATVRLMPAPLAPGREFHRHRQRQYVRRRRVALTVVLSAVAVGTLLVTAFGGAGNPTAQVSGPVAAARLLPAGPPALEAIAHVGSLALELPVNQSRYTAIGYYGSADGALTLDPLGTQANQGLIQRLWHTIIGGSSGSPRWYALPGGQGTSTSALEVGAPTGTDVYAPVSGTIVGIDKVILSGAQHGDQIEIQPTSGALAGRVGVGDRARPLASWSGATVTADASYLGEVLDLATIETQSLARYTDDAGNHVLIEVHPAATLDVP